jgi:enoyl-[acyl-carrier protein] reductase II
VKVPTAFTEEYDIAFPIVQAALGIVSMPPLVAAVSNAGGMGTLGAVGTPLMSPAELAQLITAIRSLTSRPFGVNFITPLASEDHVQVCIEQSVPVVSFHLGIPAESWVENLRAAGTGVWMQVSSAAAAREAVRAGADAVIAQGNEAGGSNCSVTGIMTLVPAVVDAIDPVPVLAAGGIADGRGLAAALALGADAVWMGTRFLASREANAHAEYKRRIVLATDTGTAITTVFHGSDHLPRPVRALRNQVVNEWTGRNDNAGPARPPCVIGRTELGGRILRVHEFSTLLPTPETAGDLEQMCLLAGESAALVHDLRPAAEIVRDLMQECTQTIASRFASLANLPAPERRLPIRQHYRP